MARQKAEVILTAKDRTKQAFASVNKNLGRFAGAAGVAGAAIALTGLTRAGLNAADALAKTSQKLGIATQDLAALRLAAEKSGVGVKQLDLGIQRATRRIAEAAQGTGEAKNALKELGLEAQELVQLTPDEQFRRLADAFEEVDGQANKVRLGFKLFDSEGVALINTLEGGRQALDDAAEATDRFGTAIGAVEAQQVEEAKDALAETSEAVKGLSTQLAVRFAPAITNTATSLANFVSFVTNDLIPAFGFLAEKIGLVRLEAKSLSEQEINVRLVLEEERLFKAEKSVARLREEVRLFQEENPQGVVPQGSGNLPNTENLEQLARKANLARAEEDQRAAAARLEELKAELERRQNIELEAERKLAEERESLRLQLREEQRAKEKEESDLKFVEEIDREREKASKRIELALDTADELRRIAFSEAREKQRALEAEGRAEEAAAARTVQLRQNASRQGIRALQTLFQGNKRVTKALFIAEKGLAIGRAVVNTSAAATKALAELGPVAGPPAAAAIKAFGAAEVATIAATALAGSGGGGGSSGPNIPINTPLAASPTTGAIDEAPAIGATSQGVTQIVFPNLFSIDASAIDALADAIRDATENRDVVFVSPTGRNAELLQEGVNG